MGARRLAVLVVAYPAALLLSQVVLFLLTALLLTALTTTSQPLTLEIGWQLFGVVAVMALAAAVGAALLAALYRGRFPSSWQRVVLGWTAGVCFLALVWAVLSPPGIALEAVLVKPGGVWLVSLAGAAGFWLVGARKVATGV